MILAMGNPLRGDDGVGIYAGKLLTKKGFKVVFAHESPENVLGQLKGDVLVLDAAHFEGDEPFVIGNPDEGHYTHKPGLKLVEKFTGARVRVIGIKTYNRGLGEVISDNAKKNADEAVRWVEMCMALPGKIKDVKKKLVDFDGKIKKARFVVPGLKEGDFVLVHAGVVVDKLSEKDYNEVKEALSCE